MFWSNSFSLSVDAKVLMCDEYLNEPVVHEDQIHSKKCTFSYIELNALSDEVNVAAVVIKEMDYDNELNQVDVSDVIESVVFESSRFQQLPKEIFERFTNVKSVSCDGVSLGFLSKADLKAAENLESFSCNSNYVQSLESMLFNSSKKLEMLDLSINEIEAIDRNAFFGLKNLKKLLLYDNKLRNLSSDIFEDLISLEEINLSSNQLTVVDEKLFENCKLLNYIYLNDNLIQQISDKSLCGIKEIKFLELSNNELSSLELNISASALYANSNQLKFVKLNSIGYLSFFNNSIADVSFEHKEGVISLNISTNKLTTNSMRNVMDFSGMRSLDLSFNKLGALNVSTFLEMPKLQILNLQSTNLSEIGYGLFTHQTGLEQLDLSYNRLNALHLAKLSAAKSLTTLFIEGNNITEIDYENIKTFFPDLKTFGFTDNPWQCAYLSALISFLEKNGIEVYKLVVEKTKSNVGGITCLEGERVNERMSYEDKSLSVNPMKHHQLVSQSNELMAISEKFEVIMRHVNESREKFVAKAELTNELFMMKSVLTSLKLDMELLKTKNLGLTLSEVKSVTNETLAVMQDNYDGKIIGLATKLENLKQSLDAVKAQLQTVSKANNIIDTHNDANLHSSKSKRESATAESTDGYVTRLMITVVFVIVCGFTVIYILKLFASRKAQRFTVRRAYSETESMDENIL